MVHFPYLEIETQIAALGNHSYSFRFTHVKEFVVNRLTAYAAQAFTEASQYIYVDNSIIKEALRWLSGIQALNGSFTEVGNIVHEELQGKTGNSLAMTAFTLIAFIENQVTRIYNIKNSRLTQFF